MIKVIWYVGNVEHTQECSDMWKAMTLSKQLKDNEQITSRIVSDEMEIIGAMGASTVTDKTLPNGDPYLWYKRRPDPHK